MDHVARTDELLTPRKSYEPPRLDELGTVDELTQTVGGSVTDDITTT